MNRKVLINSLVIISSALFLLGSCKKEKPYVIPEPPKPEPIVLHECPKDGDIYKLLIDTMIFNGKGDLYTKDSVQLLYNLDIAIPLGVCAKTADLYGTAKYSPLAAKVKTDEGISRDMKWNRNGYIRDLILPEDVKRILTFPNDKKITFELSLLDFNRDIIQSSPITIIYKERFPEK